MSTETRQGRGVYRTHQLAGTSIREDARRPPRGSYPPPLTIPVASESGAAPFPCFLGVSLSRTLTAWGGLEPTVHCASPLRRRPLGPGFTEVGDAGMPDQEGRTRSPRT